MKLVRSLALCLAVLATVGVTLVHASALDQPVLSKVTASRASITLELQAGASGAPAGFQIEWMTKSDFNNLGGWPADSYYSGLFYCEFYGVPTYNLALGTSNFVLGPNGTATVEMGDIFDETGLYANYGGELAEGADYVFRARAVGDGYSDESTNSATLFASSAPRGVVDCTLTQGFWKTHPESWTAVASMLLGTVSYTNAQLNLILNTPAGGNGLLTLAHQLIATKLNVLLGATPPPSVAAAVTAADAIIGGLIVPPVAGAGFLAPGSTSALTTILDDFNNGVTGPGHCPDTGGITGSQNSTWGRLKSLYR
jgi:hypothetical protein